LAGYIDDGGTKIGMGDPALAPRIIIYHAEKRDGNTAEAVVSYWHLSARSCSRELVPLLYTEAPAKALALAAIEGL